MKSLILISKPQSQSATSHRFYARFLIKNYAVARPAGEGFDKIPQALHFGLSKFEQAYQWTIL